MKSLTRRVSEARNMRCLLRAVNRAAMRVNPRHPDAFLALLATRPPGHADRLDTDTESVCDVEVQTDVVDAVDCTGSAARIGQLRREMVDLRDQQRMTEVVAYAMAPITAVLTLLFAGKLWTAINSVRNIAGL